MLALHLILQFKGSRDRSRAPFLLCHCTRRTRYALGNRKIKPTNYALLPVVPVMMTMVVGVIGVEVPMAMVVTVMMIGWNYEPRLVGAVTRESN
jgi:hypothetical protein